MLNRRTFLQTAAAAAVASRARPILGANDRVRLALVGAGTRGVMLAGFFGRHQDAVCVAACDVAKDRLDKAIAAIGNGGAAIEAYEDYRRILDRQDIDAVIVATPDHWHGPMTVDACAAGKDVYVEKPISNAIEPARQMVEAARTHQRVVQVGLQQRQGEHFKEAAELVRSGLLGRVTHVVNAFPGDYTVPPEPDEEPPAEVNWELFQGPAPRRPYKPSRQRRWRNFYDYGGGLVTDWGVHLVDVAHMYLDADDKAPRSTSASAQYVTDTPDPHQVPGAFTVSWQYDDFVMSFTNAVMSDPEFGLQGTYIFGTEGSLLVHRGGYQVRPGRRRRGDETPQIEPRRVTFQENYQNDPDTIAHCRDFLDCIKSRQRPVGDIEVGFHSTLPCLLGILAIQEGRTITWDGTAASPTA